MLETLIKPKSIAVIGASRTPGKVGYSILANLISSGFEGKIIPVNPQAEDILGLKCYKTPKDAGIPIDLSIIVVPSKLVKPAIEESVLAGAKSVCVITAGFKEIGPEGVILEKEIANYCKEHRVRLLGPNCLGIINTENKMNASFATQMPRPGSISVISQSGALCTAILDWSVGRGIGLSKLISIGNKADVSEIDLLQMLGEDKQTKVIACYLENIVHGEEFIKIAEQVASVKPVVILKVGTTQAGSKAASSHTGSLAGEDIAYGAAFRRAGIIRAETFESLFDYASALAMQPLPKGDRVAVITNAGGPGIMAADAIESSGLQVKPLESAVSSVLKQKLPPAASVANPIDVLGDADPERYAMALNAALDDETIDAVIVILTPQAMTRPAETARAIIKNLRGNKPVLTAFMGGANVMPAREELVTANLPDYPSPERAVYALKSMCDYSAWRRRPPRVVVRFPVNRRRIERIIRRQIREERTFINEVDAKEILQAYDFNISPGALARTDEEAVTIADRVGYPVVAKIVSPDIIHKSDIGGVRLGLSNPSQVRDAFDLMVLRVTRKMPHAKIQGIYVEKMAKQGREVILGMHRDPQFGPMLMFGLGGIFVEVMKDVSFYLAPITEEEALQMLVGTRSYSLLKGTRGQSAVDVHAIAQALQKMSQLATEFPQIHEIDINPFIVGEVGTPPTVADARMILGGLNKSHEH